MHPTTFYGLLDDLGGMVFVGFVMWLFFGRRGGND